MNRKGQFFPIKDENPRKTTPVVTWTLMGVNVAAFIISLTAFDAIIQSFGFTPAHATIITIFTSMFLHGGIAHIAGNMWFLFIFGDNIEDTFGKWMYLLFYIVAGIAATIVHWLFNVGSVIPAVGASGAISGVLGAYLVLFPHVQVHVAGRYGTSKISAYAMLGIWFGFQLISGFLGSENGVAFWAHIGGFVFGAGFAFLWKKISS